MNRDFIAGELLKVARDLVAGNVVFVAKQGGDYTLWFSYSPGSGTTTFFRGEPQGYVTDRTGDKNYNSLAKDFAKRYPADKVIPLPIYDYVRDNSRYSVFGGDLKPMKQMYVVIKKDNDIVVHFFDKKGEAAFWAKN